MARTLLSTVPGIAAFFVIACSNAPEAAAPAADTPADEAGAVEKADAKPFEAISLGCAEFENYSALARTFLKAPTRPEDRGFNVRVIPPSESASGEGAVAWTVGPDTLDIGGKSAWVACTLPRDVRGADRDAIYGAYRDGASNVIEVTVTHEAPLERAEVFAVIDASKRSVVFAATHKVEAFAKENDRGSALCAMRRDVEVAPENRVRVAAWRGEAPACRALVDASPKLALETGVFSVAAN